MTQVFKAARVALFLALAMTLASGLLNAQQKCMATTLQGGYSFQYTSGIPGSATYGVGIGVTFFDSAGQGTAIETVSINGTIIRAARATVTYTIKPDCTGTITWLYPDFGPLLVKGEFVIADNGKTLYTIGTDNGAISIGVYTRQ